MSNFVLNFDATQVDPRQSVGGVCLPLADYPMEIVKMEQEQVKDQPGKGFVAVHLKVLDGQYAGQVQIDRLNMYGQGEVPTRIAYQRLSAYAHIAGKLRVANSAELVGTKLIATCGPQDPPNEKYSEVKMVKDIAGNPPVFGQPCAPQPGQGQAFSQQTTTQPAFGTAAPAQTAQPAQQGGWNNPAAPAAETAPPANAWQTGPAGNAASSNTPPWAK